MTASVKFWALFSRKREENWTHSCIYVSRPRLYSMKMKTSTILWKSWTIQLILVFFQTVTNYSINIGLWWASNASQCRCLVFDKKASNRERQFIPYRRLPQCEAYSRESTLTMWTWQMWFVYMQFCSIKNEWYQLIDEIGASEKVPLDISLFSPSYGLLGLH